MNVVGIIAEYNPFHKGHAYQIETIKAQTNADYVIIAMSGDFIQRGGPALLDKYSRAKMALSCGADLVLELPVPFATASAELFAQGGVSLLRNTGVVTHLGFGAESENLILLQKIASILVQSPNAFEEYLQQELKAGFSFPLARAHALESYLSNDNTLDFADFHHILSSPNNILAIEYLKALAVYAPSIIPHPILRQGKGYHDTSFTKDFCSASAIRTFLQQEQCTLDYMFSKNILLSSTQLTDAMPKEAHTILASYPYSFLFENNFSSLLHYKLLMENAITLNSYADSSPELSNRILHARNSFVSWSQFCALLKTKNVTYTRLSRLLLHLLLNIHKEDALLPIPYLRVLGFKKVSSPLLHKIKMQGSSPLITAPAHAFSTLPPSAHSMLKLDITASDIYNLGCTTAKGIKPDNDYTHPIVIL
ncbi:MAG: nucleotidyltransferase [Lachnospiraceae bacterium]